MADVDHPSPEEAFRMFAVAYTNENPRATDEEVRAEFDKWAKTGRVGGEGAWIIPTRRVRHVRRTGADLHIEFVEADTAALFLSLAIAELPSLWLLRRVEPEDPTANRFDVEPNEPVGIYLREDDARLAAVQGEGLEVVEVPLRG